MGADGGSYAHRSELVKTKARVVKNDKEYAREAFKLCTLSKQPLTRPVAADPVGKLYNKDAVLEYLIDKTKYGDGESICGYLKGVKDLVTLNVTNNPTFTTDPSTSASSSTSVPFACPLSLKEMSGTVPFIALRQCGCVFSEAAVRAVVPALAKTPSLAPKEVPEEAKPIVSTSDTTKTVACPNCGKDIQPSRPDAVLPINPPEEVQEMLLFELLAVRAAAKASKKRKVAAIASTDGVDADDRDKDKKDKKDKKALKRVLEDSANGSNGKSRSNGSSPAPTSTANTGAPTTVKQKLAEQEQKRLAAQANMSEAVRSMFKPKTEGKEDETMGFFVRVIKR